MQQAKVTKLTYTVSLASGAGLLLDRGLTGTTPGPYRVGFGCDGLRNLLPLCLLVFPF